MCNLEGSGTPDKVVAPCRADRERVRVRCAASCKRGAAGRSLVLGRCCGRKVSGKSDVTFFRQGFDLFSTAGDGTRMGLSTVMRIDFPGPHMT